MRFRITSHTALTPPDHVLERLSERIPQRREGVVFTRAAGEIRVRTDRDDAVWMTQDERAEIGRRAVLDVVGELCDRPPELKLDWYAVSPAR